MQLSEKIYKIFISVDLYKSDQMRYPLHCPVILSFARYILAICPNGLNSSCKSPSCVFSDRFDTRIAAVSASLPFRSGILSPILPSAPLLDGGTYLPPGPAAPGPAPAPPGPPEDPGIPGPGLPPSPNFPPSFCPPSPSFSAPARESLRGPRVSL